MGLGEMQPASSGIRQRSAASSSLALGASHETYDVPNTIVSSHLRPLVVPGYPKLFNSGR